MDAIFVHFQNRGQLLLNNTVTDIHHNLSGNRTISTGFEVLPTAQSVLAACCLQKG